MHPQLPGVPLRLATGGTVRISLSSRNGSPLGRIFELAAFPLATMVFVTATASTAVSGDGCSHDPCYQGAALASSCSPCVTQICDANASCCSTTWNLACALA